jgi:hypothetical protein
MKEYKLSDQVRSVAKDRYVRPAIRSGKTDFSIKVRSVLDDLVPLGFPANNTPQVCNALRSDKFLRENGLEITSVDGPPSKLSTTVIVHYRVVGSEMMGNAQVGRTRHLGEDGAARAKRLTEALRGLLKQELKEYGGAEEFVRWVRSDEDAA